MLRAMSLDRKAAAAPTSSIVASRRIGERWPASPIRSLKWEIPLADVLGLGLAEISNREIKPSFDLAVRVFGKANRAGRSDPLEPRSNVDSIPHQVAVALIDHIAEMNSDPKLDAALGRQSRIALDEAVLHFDREAHRVDHAKKLDETPVADALDDAAMMGGDGGVDRVAPEPRRRESALSSSAPASRL
jgi:hypothetical protein